MTRTFRSQIKCVLLVIAMGISPAWSQTDTPPFQATVSAAEQGDRLRLDTPDGVQSYTLYGVVCDSPNTPSGQQAQRYVERTTSGKTVNVRVRGSIAGAPLVEVVLPDGKVLNHGLLAAGLGRLDRAHAAEDREYQTLELDARVAQIGIWRQGQANDRVISDVSEQPVVTELSPLDQFKRVQKIEEHAKFEMALYRWARLSETQRERERLIALRDQERAARAAIISEEESVNYLSELDEEFTALENEQVSIDETLDTISQQEEEAVSDLYRGDVELRSRQMRYDEVVAGLELATEQFGPESPQYYFYLEELEIQEVLLERENERILAEERELRAQYAEQRAGLLEQRERVNRDMSDLERDIERAENDLDRTITRNTRRTGAGSAEFSLVNRLDEAMAEGYEPLLSRNTVLTLDGIGEQTSTQFETTTDVWTVNVVTIGQSDSGVDVLVISEETKAPVAKITAGRPEYRRFVVVKDRGMYSVRVEAPDTVSWRVDVDEISAPPELFVED